MGVPELGSISTFKAIEVPAESCIKIDAPPGTGT
jgi:hypothetical protein